MGDDAASARDKLGFFSLLSTRLTPKYQHDNASLIETLSPSD
jgi:hypothetical protein